MSSVMVLQFAACAFEKSCVFARNVTVVRYVLNGTCHLVVSV